MIPKNNRKVTAEEMLEQCRRNRQEARFLENRDRPYEIGNDVSRNVRPTPLIQQIDECNPLFPASSLRQVYDRQAGPATGSFNGLHAKSKFLAMFFPTFLSLAAIFATSMHARALSLDGQFPAEAIAKLKEARAAGNAKPATIRLKGVHHLSATLRLDASLIGEGLTITGPATLSGGRTIDNWEITTTGAWTSKVDVPDIAQLYRDGRPLTLARVPDEGYFRIEKTGEDRRTNFTWQPDTIPPVDDLANTRLVFLHDWSISRLPVKSLDHVTRTLVTEGEIGPKADHYRIDHYEAQPRYYLEGARDFLTQPGEWHFDRESKTLAYLPLPDEKPESTVLTVPVIPELLVVEGGKNLRLENLTFSHAGWSPEGGRYAAGQATFHLDRDRLDKREAVPPSVLMDGVADLRISGCTFEASSTGGLWLRDNCRDAVIEKSTFRQLGGNGLMIGITGNTDTPTQRVRVDNNLIEHCGTRYFGAVGMWIGIAAEISVTANELRNLPYTGISVGWRWNPSPSASREHLIENNHIHHIMRVLSDGGGIYTLGRQPGTILRGNHIHHVSVNAGRAESNGIFMDEGSTGILVESNHIHDIARSPIRFHQAGANTLRTNRLEPAEGTPPLRFNNTPEGNITIE